VYIEVNLNFNINYRLLGSLLDDVFYLKSNLAFCIMYSCKLTVLQHVSVMWISLCVIIEFFTVQEPLTGLVTTYQSYLCCTVTQIDEICRFMHSKFTVLL